MLTAVLFAIIRLQAVEAGSSPSFYDLLPKGTVVWIGAHADDEGLVAGALLSELSRRGYQVVVVAMTPGSSTGVEGFEYNAQAALIRRLESQDACKVYEADGCLTRRFPQLAHYADQAGEQWKESAHEILEKWRGLGMVREMASLIDALDPVCVITLDPDHGMYGHPEHMAVGLAVMEVTVPRGIPVYAAENRFVSIVGENLDPGPIAWEISGRVPCGEKNCWEVGYEAVAAYRSQGLPRLDLVPIEEQATFLRQLSSRRRAAVK